MSVLALFPRQSLAHKAERLVGVLADGQGQDSAGIKAPDVTVGRTSKAMCHYLASVWTVSTLGQYTEENRAPLRRQMIDMWLGELQEI